MPKDHIFNNGMGKRGKSSYLTSKEGYYLTGFNITIKKATQKDLDLASSYAVDLVAEFERIDPKLFFMVEKDHKYTLGTQTFIYQVRAGIMILGELTLTVQILPSSHYNLNYIYRYRASLAEYNKHNDLSMGINNPRIKHNNILRRSAKLQRRFRQNHRR